MQFFIGQILLFPYSFVPRGFAACKGQLLPIVENTALYSLIGNRFGGDGVTNFGLPDYSKIQPPGSTYCIALTGSFAQQ